MIVLSRLLSLITWPLFLLDCLLWYHDIQFLSIRESNANAQHCLFSPTLFFSFLFHFMFFFLAPQSISYHRLPVLLLRLSNNVEGLDEITLNSCFSIHWICFWAWHHIRLFHELLDVDFRCMTPFQDCSVFWLSKK